MTKSEATVEELVGMTERGRRSPVRACTIWSARSQCGRGYTNIHPHMLRHTCGFALANRSRDTRLIQDYLGHIDIRNTEIYTRTAARRFEGLWE